MEFAFENAASGGVKGANYKSFEEAGEYAISEFNRLESKGYLERIGTWEQVLERWPAAMPTRIAVLMKDRPDGTKKIRFIMDALRSGANGVATAEERIVLPRGCDLVESILDLWEENWQRSDREDFGVEIMIADFVDAFLTLGLVEEERGYVVVTDNREWFAYRSVPFGIGTYGPAAVG